MTRVGVMQGRLLPPFEDRFQAFPADQWRQEFDLARDAGLDCIEWIYERPHETDNPLASPEGIAEMRALMDQTGVAVRSICADYYMTERLIGTDGEANIPVIDHLHRLISQAAELSALYIILPFVDQSSLKTGDQRTGIVEVLKELARYGEDRRVELHLETDLPPQVFRTLLDAIDHPYVRANFDIGNSASLGYDPSQEIGLLAPYLASVHVKDRLFGGGTVALGTGNADFVTCFKLIRTTGFARPFILQAARGENGQEVELAIQNRTFVEGHMAQ